MVFHKALMNQKLKTLALVLTILVSGCSPKYKTVYSYEPPTSDTGRVCVTTCLQTKQQCLTNENALYQQCRAQSEAAKQACRSDEAYKKAQYMRANPGPLAQLNYIDNSSNCGWVGRNCDQPNEQMCETLYSQCYEGCGGKVTSGSVCIRYCDS